MTATPRAFEPADAIGVQRLASRLWPIGRHPGGLGWELATDQLATEIVVFGEEGWAGVDGSGQLVAQVDPTCPDVARSVVDWFLDVAEGPSLRAHVFDGDDVIRRALEDAGFAHDAVAAPGYGMAREATTDVPLLANGYTVRAVEPAEFVARAAVHRDAWQPALLPWHPDHRPAIDADATSAFTDAVYERVRKVWLYDIDLDLVAVAPDGTFAACCIVWFDPGIGVAEIEPLGVDPAHRGNGLAGALCLEATARVVALGGRELFINNGPRVEYPAPYAAYSKAGFGAFERSRTYTLRRS